MNKFISLLPELNPLDLRLNAIRDDLADSRIKDKVESVKFVQGRTARITAPVSNLKAAPDPKANTEHQLLVGENIDVFEETDAWAWVQSNRDNYVGYVDKSDIQVAESLPQLTHRVRIPRTFLYSRAELREPPVAVLSMGSEVGIEGYETIRGTKYALLKDGGAVIEKHLGDIALFQDDYVNTCEQLIHTPYLWAGATGMGIDCSGLVQLAMRMCGRFELRDSDMQAATIGSPIEPGTDFVNLQRGDLIFWRGHVAIHKGTIHRVPHIIHASGHTMSVAIEPLKGAIERIAYLYEKPIGYRRP